jgi:cellulose synthase/poly-beta-1,6-N-acetylglucosamine synthase-like glycosyltransferase
MGRREANSRRRGHRPLGTFARAVLPSLAGVGTAAAIGWNSLVDLLRAFLTDLDRLRVPLGGIPVVLVIALGFTLFARSARTRADSARELESFQPYHEVLIPPEERRVALRPADTSPRGVHIWRKDAVTSVTEPVVPPAPSLVPPPPTPFVRNLVVTFALLVATMMLFRHPFFYVYDRIVLALSVAVYWPVSYPSALAGTSVAHTVPDYIFLVYLAFIGAYLIASGLITSDRFRPDRVRRSVAVALAYPPIAILADVLLFTSGEPFSHSAALLVRGILGGVMVAGLVLASVELPEGVRVRPTLPAEPGIVAVFFLAIVAAIVLGLVVLYLVFQYVGIGRTFLPIGILLLLPMLSITIWALIGRAVYDYDLRNHPLPPVSVYHPPVSILIPAYNEGSGIAEAIRSADAAARLYPGATEILVGNDGSTDATLTEAIGAIRELREATGAVLDLPHGGKSSALNAMLRVARGEIIVRVDADSRISSTLGFSALVPHFADRDIGGVQGLILPLQQEGWTRRLRFIEIAWNHLFLRRATMGVRACQVIDGAFSAYRRSDLLAVGGWVPWNGEDTEITIRLQRRGYRMRLETEAAAFEDVPENYRKLERQRIRWGRGGIYARYRHLYPSFTEAWAFGGLAMLYWLALFIRSGLRSGLYVYVVLAAIFVPTIVHLAIILAILLVPRGIVIGAYLLQLRRGRWIPWIFAWPVFSLIKQHYSVKAWGTMFPGEAGEYV